MEGEAEQNEAVMDGAAQAEFWTPPLKARLAAYWKDPSLI